MKLKSLLVITLFVVACSFASAQTFGFASTGGTLYCNYEQLTNYGTGFYAGVDNLSACGLSVNATIAGFAGTDKPLGAPVAGPGVIYGDSIYAVYNGMPNAMWAVFTKLKANKVNKYGHFLGNYSWIGIAAFSGVYAGDNYGYLSATIPGAKGVVVTKGASTLSKQ